jgi:LmbE family N-acetylglucosaminyl deacetylase
MRILSLHAHPDDAEILAAGTLAQLARIGHSISIATMTAGDCGSDDLTGEEIADIRRQEAKRSAAVINAEYHCLGFSDLSIFVDEPSRRRVTAALRRFRPDIVLTASPIDYHCDHEATSKLVIDACFAASVPNYGTLTYEPAPPLERIPHLYFMDPTEGIDRDGAVVNPHFVVDIDTTLPTKRDMLARHESQRAWLQRQHGMSDYLAEMEKWTRERGRLAGIACGEGFRQYTGHPYPRTPALQDLLGHLVHKLQ